MGSDGEKHLVGFLAAVRRRYHWIVRQRLKNSNNHTTIMITSHTSPDVTITLDVDPIRRIDVQDLDAVDSFSRKTKGDITTLKFKFADGGVFNMSYTKAGKVVDFHGNKIGVEVSEEHIVTLKMFTQSPVDK